MLSFNGLHSDILGGELFMHLEREGIFMEDTATYGLDFCLFYLLNQCIVTVKLKLLFILEYNLIPVL